MPLFESKPRLSIEECCRQFYDSNIFHAIILGNDGWAFILDTYFKSIAEVDQSFLSVDSSLFRKEMTALRMELFAFACSKNSKTGKYAIRQSFFTRRYLEENGNLEIWDIMADYNLPIAMSATMDASGKFITGAIGRALATSGNLRKAELLNAMSDLVTDDNQIGCVSRVANRIGADINRANGIVVKLLGTRLANRLGCDVNLKYEALFRLSACGYGFYKGAEEYLKSVDLQG